VTAELRSACMRASWVLQKTCEPKLEHVSHTTTLHISGMHHCLLVNRSFLSLSPLPCPCCAYLLLPYSSTMQIALGTTVHQPKLAPNPAPPCNDRTPSNCHAQRRHLTRQHKPKKDDKPCTCPHSPILSSSPYSPLDSQWLGNCGPESLAQAITVRLVV
jgi:hypothetical protein